MEESASAIAAVGRGGKPSAHNNTNDDDGNRAKGYWMLIINKPHKTSADGDWLLMWRTQTKHGQNNMLHLNHRLPIHPISQVTGGDWCDALDVAIRMYYTYR